MIHSADKFIDHIDEHLADDDGALTPQLLDQLDDWRFDRGLTRLVSDFISTSTPSWFSSSAIDALRNPPFADDPTPRTLDTSALLTGLGGGGLIMFEKPAVRYRTEPEPYDPSTPIVAVDGLAWWFLVPDSDMLVAGGSDPERLDQDPSDPDEDDEVFIEMFVHVLSRDPGLKRRAGGSWPLRTLAEVDRFSVPLRPDLEVPSPLAGCVSFLLALAQGLHDDAVRVEEVVVGPMHGLSRGLSSDVPPLSTIERYDAA